MYYGGQAVVEGVMIRGPHEMAVAVRAPDGRIVTRSERLSGVYTGLPRRIPILRGVIVLYETLALGLRALTWSSQVATGRDEEDVSRTQLFLTLGLMLLFVGAVFFAGPVLLDRLGLRLHESLCRAARRGRPPAPHARRLRLADRPHARSAARLRISRRRASRDSPTSTGRR